MYDFLFVFQCSFSHSMKKSLSFVLFIMVLIVAYLLKSAKISVSKFCLFDSVVIFEDCELSFYVSFFETQIVV